MAGSRYVEITLDEMEAFLKRAYHALQPKKSRYRTGQMVFDLSLSDNHQIFIRVYSSIFSGGVVQRKGEDSIKVVMLTDNGKALMPKAKLVMQTTNWRSALQDRIEDFLELYESKVEYWKKRRLQVPDGSTPQVDALDEAVEESLPELTPRERARLEDAEEQEVRQEEEYSKSLRPTPEPPPKMPGPKKTKPGPPFEGKYRKLRSGDWGITITTEGRPGLEGVAVTNGGKRRKVRLLQKEKAFRDQYNGNVETELWTFEDVNGAPRQEGYGGNRWAAEADPLAENVVARYLNA